MRKDFPLRSSDCPKVIKRAILTEKVEIGEKDLAIEGYEAVWIWGLRLKSVCGGHGSPVLGDASILSNGMK